MNWHGVYVPPTSPLQGICAQKRKEKKVGHQIERSQKLKRNKKFLPFVGNVRLIHTNGVWCKKDKIRKKGSNLFISLRLYFLATFNLSRKYTPRSSRRDCTQRLLFFVVFFSSVIGKNTKLFTSPRHSTRRKESLENKTKKRRIRVCVYQRKKGDKRKLSCFYQFGWQDVNYLANLRLREFAKELFFTTNFKREIKKGRQHFFIKTTANARATGSGFLVLSGFCPAFRWLVCQNKRRQHLFRRRRQKIRRNKQTQNLTGGVKWHLVTSLLRKDPPPLGELLTTAKKITRQPT